MSVLLLKINYKKKILNDVILMQIFNDINKILHNTKAQQRLKSKSKNKSNKLFVNYNIQ